MCELVSGKEMISEINSDGLRDSLAFVLNAGGKKSQKVLTDLTRVNEQQMYAALIHSQLKAHDQSAATGFAESFNEQLSELSQKKTGDFVFRAAKRALRGIRLLGVISRSFAGQIRQFALGKAQLDSKRDELSIRNITGKAGDTALRALRTALTKFENNDVATKEEIDSFKQLNRVNRRHQQNLMLQ